MELTAELADRLQRAATDHVAACNNALFASEMGEDPVSPASAPFCGCDTCVIRETLHAAWGVLEEDAC